MLWPAALQVALGKPLLLQASAESASRAPLRLRVSRPPEPSDVLWENLPCSRLECGLRQALGRVRVRARVRLRLRVRVRVRVRVRLRVSVSQG